MLRLFRAEIEKLFSDKQFIAINIFIAAYLMYSFFIVETPPDISFEGWVISKTTDSIIMIFLIGIVGATVFTIDYSNKMLKNFLPYTEKAQVFAAKVLANMLGVFVALFFWYIIVFLGSVIAAGTCDVQVILPMLSRFVMQYLLLLFHTAMIQLVGTVTRNRAVASSFTVIAWLLYSFLPVRGEYFYDVIVSGYAWKQPFSIGLAVFFLLVYILCCFLGSAIFARQEVGV